MIRTEQAVRASRFALGEKEILKNRVDCFQIRYGIGVLLCSLKTE